MFTVLFLFSLLVVHNSAQVVGLWFWTWGTDPKSAPSKSTHGFAFDGTVLPDAINNSATIKGNLAATKILGIGGGTTKWTQALIDQQTSLISTVKTAGYEGVAIDIEEGEEKLSFTALFAAVKNQNLQLWVTVSHSTPYGIPDTAALMKNILASDKVDYISPQLYTTGTESEPDYTADNVQWSDYANIHAKVVPSIPSGSMYAAVFCHFKQTFGITLGGYIQWQQFGYAGTGPQVPTCSGTPTPPKQDPNQAINACGTLWATASCSKPCPSGQNRECPQNQYCFAGVSCLATGTGSGPSTGSGTGVMKACGADWASAVKKGCSATPCPGGVDSQCPNGEKCFADVPCASAANSAVVVTEKNADGSTTTTATIITSESIPAYGVALLCLAVLVIVVLVTLIALLTSKKQNERV